MKKEMHEALHRIFGFRTFRPNQEAIVSHVLAGRDVFAVMPTGGGKSLCYQLPARILDGLCVVVSPLISLMKDQVDAAKANGLDAEFLNSSLPVRERRRVFEALERQQLDLLYVSPERFAMPDFMIRLKQANIAFFAIDEAHCISEWGHDFRPDYLSLSSIATHFPKAHIAAFTATATQRVQDDILCRLGLRNPFVVRASFDRPNLFYQVLPKENLHRQLLRFLRARPNEAGIIYRTTRRNVESTARFLRGQGISALPYHAGLPDAERRRHQEQFNRDEVCVIVATIAFGMGIDKSNVRFILHGDLPRNVEGYYQETGRAGRDGDPAHCCLYFSPGDAVKIRYFIDQMEDRRERRTALDQLNRMVRIAEANVCRRRAILGYFGETYPKDDCETCDVCTGEVDRLDATEDAQKIMSAIYRTGRKFGAAHIVDIVAGADTRRIRQFGHDRLKTYGVGRGREKRYWRRIVDDLLAQGCVVPTDDPYPVLQLSEKGMQVLRGQCLFEVLRRKQPAARESSATGATEYSEGLFAELRAERKRTAAELSVPPFVVFSDRTLHEMARCFPVDEVVLRRVSGVGATKYERFGERFLSVIRAYRETHPDEAEAFSDLQIPADVPEREKKTEKKETLEATRELVQQGMSIDAIASERGLTPGTIAQHIEKLLERGEPLDVDQFIEPARRLEIEALFSRLNADSLKPVIAAGDGDITYEQARLVRAFMQVEK